MLIAILKKALSEGHTVLPLTPKDLPSVKKDLRHYYDEINKYLPEDVRIDFDRFLELIDEYEEYIKEPNTRSSDRNKYFKNTQTKQLCKKRCRLSSSSNNTTLCLHACNAKTTINFYKKE